MLTALGLICYKGVRILMMISLVITEEEVLVYVRNGIHSLNFTKTWGDPPEYLSLDRIDNNGNYCKENCRWTDRNTQMRNRRRAVLLEFNGQTRHLREWAEILGLKHATIKCRLQRGWTVEEALTPLSKT